MTRDPSVWRLVAAGAEVDAEADSAAGVEKESKIAGSASWSGVSSSELLDTVDAL